MAAAAIQFGFRKTAAISSLFNQLSLNGINYVSDNGTAVATKSQNPIWRHPPS